MSSGKPGPCDSKRRMLHSQTGTHSHMHAHTCISVSRGSSASTAGRGGRDQACTGRARERTVCTPARLQGRAAPAGLLLLQPRGGLELPQRPGLPPIPQCCLQIPRQHLRKTTSSVKEVELEGNTGRGAGPAPGSRSCIKKRAASRQEKKRLCLAVTRAPPETEIPCPCIRITHSVTSLRNITPSHQPREKCGSSL